MKKWVLILLLLVWSLYLMDVTWTKNDAILDNLQLKSDSIMNMNDLARKAIAESIREQQIIWGPHSQKLLDTVTRMDIIEKKSNMSTVEEIVPRVIPGVVHVMCPEWQGSGFVVGPRLIATARHIVEGVTDFEITTYDGHRLRAARAISFKNRDVGFIWIDDLRCVSEVGRELECAKVKHEVKLHVLELGSIKECNLGQNVFAIGSPYGKINFNHLSSGIISALDRSWDMLGEDYGWEIGWITTVAGHPGNSGCPIFTLDGRVRGVLVGGFSPVLVMAMPVDLFKDRLDEVTLMFGMDQFRKEKSIPQTVEDWSYTSKGN